MQFDRHYYENQYRNYERQNPARKIEFYRGLTLKAAAGRERPRVLDIGCAFGTFLSGLDKRWELFGVDASQYAIDLARERVPWAKLEVTLPGAFPFSGPFDVIAAFDVLEHIESLNEIMSWVALNLTPGGGLVFVVPVYDGPTGPVIRTLDKDPTHVHRESRDFWLNLVEDRFEMVDWWGITRYLFPGGFYLHAVTHRWRRFTPAIACLLRRIRA